MLFPIILQYYIKRSKLCVKILYAEVTIPMQVSRTSPGGDAIMAIGVDSRPPSVLKQAIARVPGVQESILVTDDRPAS